MTAKTEQNFRGRDPYCSKSAPIRKSVYFRVVTNSNLSGIVSPTVSEILRRKFCFYLLPHSRLKHSQECAPENYHMKAGHAGTDRLDNGYILSFY